MAKVKQCDRCGKLENPQVLNGGVGRVEFPNGGLKVHFWASGSVDLCTDCLKEFLEYKKPIV